MIAGAIKFILCERKTFWGKVKNVCYGTTGNDVVGADEIEILPAGQKRKLCNELRDCDLNTNVSIIMPTRNRAGIINKAIHSVLSQTYENWELLVVDDGSEDGTRKIVKKFADSDHRIRYLPIKHSGVSTARNFGLEQSKGEVIAYLDSDNSWDPDFLLIMTNAVLENHWCAYCVLIISHHDQKKKPTYRKNSFNLEQLKLSNYIDLNAFVHKRELFAELGGFDDSLKRCVDWDLILRYTSKYSPSAVPFVLCNYNNRKNLKRISTHEPLSYEMVVRNKYLIDWDRLEKNIAKRKRSHVTIVIPVFNQARLTANCVHSIFRETTGNNFDVLLVDNRSTLLTKATIWNLARTYDRVSYLENSSNYFFALGCNLGVAASTGEFIILLNNDTVVTDGWLTPLIEPLKNDSSIGIVGPQLLYPDNSLQAGGMAFSPHSKIPYHIYAGFAKDTPAINKQRIFKALTGACYAMRAHDYIQSRGFDPIFQNGCEDIDLCFRLKSMLGKNVFYNPESVVFHYEGKTKGRGKAKHYNRETFVSRWGHTIKPDDMEYYRQDGYIVKDYIKKDDYRPHESLYKPILEPEQTP